MEPTGALSALGAGLLSFFSPCMLPLLPVYLGVLASDPDGERSGLGRRMAMTAAFVAGVSVVFILLGAGSGAAGSLLDSPGLRIALGISIFIAGLALAGVVRIPALQRERRADLSRIRVRAVPSAFLLGLAFSFGWTPCIGPVLGAILALAAQSGGALQGAGLLALYSVGMCVPFLTLALASDALLRRVRALSSHMGAVQKAGGALIAAMGLWMVFSQVPFVATTQAPVGTADAPAAAGQGQGEGKAGSPADERKGSQAGGGASSASDRSASPASASADGAVSVGTRADAGRKDWDDVELYDLDGARHTMADYRGKPLYFEFWGTWCPVCMDGLDDLAQLSARHEEAGDVQVVTVVFPGLFGEKNEEDFVRWARAE